MSTAVQTLTTPSTRARSLGFSVLATIGFTALTAVAAHIRVPLPYTPVPVTMQTFVVLLAGLALGPGLGAASQLLYVLLGAAGFPLFAGSAIGLAYLTGPTAGYLVGFMAAAALVGFIAGRERELWRSVVAVAAGLTIIYACGSLYMAYVMGLGLSRALALGVVPFIAGDVVKGTALLVATGARRMLR